MATTHRHRRIALGSRAPACAGATALAASAEWRRQASADASAAILPRHPARAGPSALRLRPQRLARLRLPVPLQLSCCPECNGIALLL